MFFHLSLLSLVYIVYQSLKLRSIPPSIIHHFSWLFEPVIMVIVMCMICMIILHDFAFFVVYTPKYHTTFFMIFQAHHNGDSYVHDLHDFASPFLMILFLCYVYPYISHFIIFWATQWWNYCLGCSWFSMTNFYEVLILKTIGCPFLGIWFL